MYLAVYDVDNTVDYLVNAHKTGGESLQFSSIDTLFR